MMGSNSRNQIPLKLLHAARPMIRLTGVQPAVDLSWKALLYGMVKVLIVFFSMFTCNLK